MTLLERLRILRTDPIMLLWLEDHDVMWLPKCTSDGIVVPLFSMEKKTDGFMIRTTSAKVELSWPQFRIWKLERSNSNQENGQVFLISDRDCLACKELFLKYHALMDRYLHSGDLFALEEAKACECKINGLLRRVQ